MAEESSTKARQYRETFAKQRAENTGANGGTGSGEDGDNGRTARLERPSSGYFARKTGAKKATEDATLNIGQVEDDRTAGTASEKTEPVQDRITRRTSKTSKVAQEAIASVTAVREQEAKELSDLALLMLSQLGVMYTKNPDAALNMMETMMLSGPLSQWLSTPAIYARATKNMTPIMLCVGLGMYGLRIQGLRTETVQKEKAEKLAAQSLNQQPTTEFVPDRPGQVNPDLFTNGTTDPALMEAYLSAQPDVIPSVNGLDTSIFGNS